MTNSKHRIGFAVALALAGGLAAAQDAPAIEPRADKILRVMSDVLAEAREFTVHNVQTSDEVTESGNLVELSSSVELAVRRPGEAHAVLGGDLRPMRYWIGGGRVAVMDIARWTYAVAEVPEGLDAAVDYVWDEYDMKIPLDDFISVDPYAALTGNVEMGAYVGLHEVDGVRCHHLAFLQDDIDWQIWIEDGMLPLPRKLLIVYKNEPGAPRYTARLSNWDLSPGLGDTVFTFTPPEGAEQIEFAERVKAKGE
jgi:hypothetical protein